MKHYCPFLQEFNEVLDCPYLGELRECEEIEINQGNSDAWCRAMIGKAMLVHKIFIGNDY